MYMVKLALYYAIIAIVEITELLDNSAQFLYNEPDIIQPTVKEGLS